MSDNWNEKRKNRSEVPSVAIKLQLEHLYHSGDLRNYTLVDESGLVVSQAGVVEESHAVAAYAPLIARGDTEIRETLTAELAKTIPNFSPEHFAVREFVLEGEQPLFLAIFGDDEAPGEAEMEHAIEGIQRIIRTTSAFKEGEDI